ncbi:MAG: restriction endonuclease [Armatimonadetes bacterium]|nr:restriction endonuclease [Armatimonadota bacterium]
MDLTAEQLKWEAGTFALRISGSPIEELYGITDGKAIGTFVEQRFHQHLRERYVYSPGSAARGHDFPDLGVDVKTTSVRQPQSSSPYQSAGEKVYGLATDLLIFVYEKQDDPQAEKATLRIVHAVYVARARTADYQTTFGINEIIRRDGNRDDIVAFLEERNLPLDETGRQQLADRILRDPPPQGYLTISNALQWRLQFGRVIQVAGAAPGVEDLLAQRNG